MTSLNVSEFNELAASLSRQAPRVGRRAAAALRATAARVEKTQKDLAPFRDGDLRDSISTDLYGSGNSRRMLAVIGPTVEYGAIVEFGRANNPPQPYVGPSVDAHERGFLEALERAAEMDL